ncbi:hypothetical protein SAMN02910358_01271 [Lachnospiraceae bacterium XBB1006]|nr:hypothetical protein SAMN02910358_01271 [Lachnospiraceae bacterium XBB1006]
MDIRDIFVMNAKGGVLLINPRNAEMMAVRREHLQTAVDVLTNDKQNQTCASFIKPITEEEMVRPESLSVDGIGIIASLKCNFACKYCFEQDFDKSEMTPEMIPFIRKFIAYWNREMDCEVDVKSVGLMGGEIFRGDTHVLVEDIMEQAPGIRAERNKSSASRHQTLLISYHRITYEVNNQCR